MGGRRGFCCGASKSEVSLLSSQDSGSDVNSLITVGIWPVPPEERTDTQFFKIFFIWFTANFNILSFSAGTLGPVAFGLGVRDTCLVILFFNLFFCAVPAYM